MIVGVAKETYPGERRVALVPAVIPAITKAGLGIAIQSGAGAAAGYPDEVYKEKGAEIEPDRPSLFAKSDILFQVHGLGSNPVEGRADLELLRRKQVLIGLHMALSKPREVQTLAERGVTVFAIELLPRITRAQSMDVLSSMATVAGYKAVLLAASALPRMFPMLMTAAGSITPARVFVVGAGVAGLQAIATARRLGAVVSAYDVRPAVKEQIHSLGGKFVEFDLKTETSEDKGGYAKAMDEEFYRRQREAMKAVVVEHDVVICTAAVPGKKAPVLITGEMVHAMRPGSVIVDLAAESGGNCELTRPGETYEVGGVILAGPVNLVSTIPYHASQMYGRNLQAFLMNHLHGGNLQLHMTDEITRETLVVLEGEIVHPKIRELLGLPGLRPEEAPAP
jgi:NAD(P) transhydrogenase subunit alpha